MSGDLIKFLEDLNTDDAGFIFNPPEADKGLIPRRLRRFNAFVDTPLLCSGVVHPRPGDTENP